MQKRLIAMLFALLAAPGLVWAQPEMPDEAHPRQVFLQLSTETGANRLIFLDLLTGERSTVDVYGERYAVTPAGVLFYAPGENRVKIAMPDATLRDHPFIQPGPNTRRIDWVVDPDAHLIAWTLTEGVPGTMTTLTYVADFAGDDARLVFEDGPRDGIRALPVTFSPDRQQLYMDYQPDSIGDRTTFRQFAGLFALNLADGEIMTLPGEPGCFCGAGLGGDWFLRLALTPDVLSFDLHAYHLERGIDVVIPSLRLVDFTQGGDILISPDGSRAIYALAQVIGFGTPAQMVRTVFVRVDLEALTQDVLGSEVDFLLRPIAWTEDNSAVLLTSPEGDGTWKIDLADGTLEQVAAATYLGRIRGQP
jgi:hypothetical protein